jgi:hypothetical protein
MKERKVHGADWDIEPMFEETYPVTPKGEGGRQKPAPSVEFGTCPMCSTGKRIGLVRVGKHLVWRLHERRMMNGSKAVCPASGTALCDTPSRIELIGCPHA